MTNSLDPDQAQGFVGSDLGLNCLHRLSADDESMQRVKLIPWARIRITLPTDSVICLLTLQNDATIH